MSSTQSAKLWRAERWTSHALTSVVVDDPTSLSGKRVVAECGKEEDAKFIARTCNAHGQMVAALRLAEEVARVGIFNAAKTDLLTRCEEARRAALAAAEA